MGTLFPTRTAIFFYSSKLLDRAELIVTFQVTSLLWLVNVKPAVEDAVVVEGVGVGVDSPRKMRSWGL
jgi:hypothetical protein